jgi:hypothetical protein
LSTFFWRNGLKMAPFTATTALIFAANLMIVEACLLGGSDTGYCDARIDADPTYKKLEMPFCGPVVTYTACVPKQDPIPPDRKFNRFGRWYNHTTLNKDQVISDSVLSYSNAHSQFRRSGSSQQFWT